MNSDKREFIEQFQKQTKSLAIDGISSYKTLPKSEEAVIMQRQPLQSATSVASNYRAACRARSSAENFIQKSVL